MYKKGGGAFIEKCFKRGGHEPAVPPPPKSATVYGGYTFTYNPSRLSGHVGYTYSPIVHNQWTQLGTERTLVGAGHLRAILIDRSGSDRHNLRVNRSLPFCVMPKCKLIPGLHYQKMMKYEHLKHIHRL